MRVSKCTSQAGRQLGVLVLLLAALVAWAAPSAWAATLSGTASYSGEHSPVSSTRPILLYLWDTPSPMTDPVARATVTANGGGFDLEAPSDGTYYLAVVLDVDGNGDASVGEPFQVYNGRGSFPGDPITVPASGVGLTFDDTAKLAGIAGTLRYTGSLGAVSPENQVIVTRFLDAGLTLEAPDDTRRSVDTNGGRYNFLTLDTGTYYLEAFFDLNGNGQRDIGEPFTIYNHRSLPPADPVVAGPDQIALDLTFGDENVSPNPVQLDGVITYTGAFGPVSATQPIGLELHPDALFEQDQVDKTKVTVNSGAFTLNAPVPGNYYLAYFLDRSNSGNASVGDPYQIFDHRYSFPGDPISLPQSQLTFQFDDTGILSGIAGTVTYTGALASISEQQRIVVQAFRDADLTQPAASDDRVKASPARYNVITLDTNTYFLKAFVDLNGNGQTDAGEPFTIYNGRGAPPADPVAAGPAQTAIDITFGDEHLQPGACAGDCDGGGSVTVNEIVTLINIALGNATAAGCPDGVPGGAEVNVAVIIQAINHALDGC